jgi:hypothetical protein
MPAAAFLWLETRSNTLHAGARDRANAGEIPVRQEALSFRRCFEKEILFLFIRFRFK